MRVVEIVPDLVVEINPDLVVEIVPDFVVEMVPDLVVEMVPLFANAGADTTINSIPAHMIDLRFFIGSTPGVKNRQGVWSAFRFRLRSMPLSRPIKITVWPDHTSKAVPHRRGYG